MGELTWGRVYYLSLMTLSYIVGELTHFLVNTTSRALARDLQFGDLSCFNNQTADTSEESQVNCTSLKEEKDCVAQTQCYWHYNGLGLQYQVRERFWKSLK